MPLNLKMPLCKCEKYVLPVKYIRPHDDVIKWKHFPRYWPFVRGIHRSPVNSPHKGQWRGALMFTFIYTRINGWVNNCEAGNLRCNRAHYDVIVMNLHDVIRRMAMITQSGAIWSIWAGASLAIESDPLMFVGNQRIGCWYPWNENIMSQSNYALMTSSNGNIFRVTGPLWRESTSDRWIPHTKVRDA